MPAYCLVPRLLGVQHVEENGFKQINHILSHQCEGKHLGVHQNTFRNIRCLYRIGESESASTEAFEDVLNIPLQLSRLLNTLVLCGCLSGGARGTQYPRFPQR